jgi:hypothetical protein
MKRKYDYHESQEVGQEESQFSVESCPKTPGYGDKTTPMTSPEQQLAAELRSLHGGWTNLVSKISEIQRRGCTQVLSRFWAHNNLPPNLLEKFRMEVGTEVAKLLNVKPNIFTTRHVSRVLFRDAKDLGLNIFEINNVRNKDGKEVPAKGVELQSLVRLWENSTFGKYFLEKTIRDNNGKLKFQWRLDKVQLSKSATEHKGVNGSRIDLVFSFHSLCQQETVFTVPHVVWYGDESRYVVEQFLAKVRLEWPQTVLVGDREVPVVTLEDSGGAFDGLALTSVNGYGNWASQTRTNPYSVCSLKHMNLMDNSGEYPTHAFYFAFTTTLEGRQGLSTPDKRQLQMLEPFFVLLQCNHCVLHIKHTGTRGFM